MKTISPRLWLIALTILVSLPALGRAQSLPASLASLPEADVLIYVSPQRILNEAAPKVMLAKDLLEMRTEFAELKKTVGIDPATVEYLVIAVRFQKPAGDLSFVAPDVMAVAGGDFSSDSLFTLAQLTLQSKVRMEKHGSKSIAIMKVDPIAAEAEKTPMLKSLVELGAVPLSANSIAVGTVPYLKSAIDAANGTGRINPATLESLLRDPNVLVASTGAPLTALAKAFGLFGTATTPRDWRCESGFGNFYSAITMSGTNFSLRGAMNADNPDTAKIISGLLAGLMQQGIGAVPDKEAQTILQSIKMMPKDNEVVWEADVPQQLLANLVQRPPVAKVEEVKAPALPKRTIRKKRSRH